MIGRSPGRALVRGVAICGALTLMQIAAPVEVDLDAMQGRTEAAIAEFRAAVRLEPDLQHGAGLFTLCAACHAADGRGTSDGSVPAIAGQHVSVLVKQLADFRHDRRWDERMQNFSSNHHLGGPQDLLDVAAYAESLPRSPPLGGGTGRSSALKRGNVVYHRYCEGCHGALGLGELRRIRPRLAGQHYQYLLLQFEQTAAGNRPGMDAEHVRLIRRLSARDRSAVADYVSRLSPNLTSTRDRVP